MGTGLIGFVRVASKVIGVNQVRLSELYVRQVARKTRAIWTCTDHPLKRELELLPSGRRYRVSTHRTKRFGEVCYWEGKLAYMNGTYFWVST